MRRKGRKSLVKGFVKKEKQTVEVRKMQRRMEYDKVEKR